MAKDSFIIHLDSLDILDEMTDEQAGKLVKAWKAFKKGEVMELDNDIKMAFIPFRNQFLRDDEKYNKIVARNRQNGSLGGRPEGTPKPTQPIPKEPKKPKETHSVIPEYEEFYEYALSNAENICDEKIKLKYKSWVENGWKDGKNVAIKNWKTKLLNTIQYLKSDGKQKFTTGAKTGATYSKSKAIDTAQTLFGGSNRTEEN